jgi:hypothetical protein
MRTTRRLLAVTAALVVAVGATALPAGASHSWGGYHWARTANPFTLAVGDNVSGAWDSYLSTTSSDWSKSTVLDTRIVAGRAGLPYLCLARAGRVEVCNASYGKNGWLGIGSVWTNGLHITQGTVKLNDTYFSTAAYNTPAWRNLVSCQEVGHTLGLDHQDENFTNANLGTCMDYTNNPSTNQHPNQHDYDELSTIYAHRDTTTTVGSASATALAEGGNNPSDWGRAIRYSGDGRPSLFQRDLPRGERVFTFVIWAE